MPSSAGRTAVVAVQLQNADLHISLLSGQNLPKPHGLIHISSKTDFPQTMLPLFCSRIYYHTIFDDFFANFVIPEEEWFLLVTHTKEPSSSFREVVESPPPEIFKKHVDLELGSIV